jgi:uncharacterized damage-inducible protein DinB
MDVRYLRTLARYNQWANTRLYDACAALSEDAYHKARPSFFGSIHATLNHLLVGDRIWLGRIEGIEHGITKLDQVLCEDLAALRRAREAEDARIIALADGLDDERLAEDFAFTTISMGPGQLPLGDVLGHLMNHQTHHRGQAHDMLSQTDVPPPSLDLLIYLHQA